MSFGLHCWASRCLTTMTTTIDDECVAAEALVFSPAMQLYRKFSKKMLPFVLLIPAIRAFE